MSGGPRYTIFQADAAFDKRLSDLQVRVLSILGTHTDNNGWCAVNQRKLAEAIGRSRETINRVIRDLCEFGYLTKKEQKTSANGRTISLYQVLMDRPLVAQDAAPPVTPESLALVTGLEHSGSDPAASQLNDPSSNDPTPQPPETGGEEFFEEVWESYSPASRGNRENVQGAMRHLSRADGLKVLGAVPVALKIFALRRQRVPSLKTFVSQRMFLEYFEAPAVDFDGDFIITPANRDEWNAWLGEVRRDHGAAGVERAIMPGKLIRKTRWPEGHALHIPPLRQRAAA